MSELELSDLVRQSCSHCKKGQSLVPCTNDGFACNGECVISCLTSSIVLSAVPSSQNWTSLSCWLASLRAQIGHDVPHSCFAHFYCSLHARHAVFSAPPQHHKPLMPSTLLTPTQFVMAVTAATNFCFASLASPPFAEDCNDWMACSTWLADLLLSLPAMLEAAVSN